MYNLRKNSVGYDVLVNKKIVYSGDLPHVCVFMTMKLEIEVNEIEDAVNELEWMDHNSAEFGIYKTFMFSRQIEEKKAA